MGQKKIIRFYTKITSILNIKIYCRNSFKAQKKEKQYSELHHDLRDQIGLDNNQRVRSTEVVNLTSSLKCITKLGALWENTDYLSIWPQKNTKMKPLKVTVARYQPKLFQTLRLWTAAQHRASFTLQSSKQLTVRQGLSVCCKKAWNNHSLCIAVLSVITVLWHF